MATNFKYLNRQLQELEEYFPFVASSNSQISKVNVGWHLAHSFKVINGICFSLKKSDPQEYKPTFNIKRVVVFTLGSFPRGKIKAPKVVIPDEKIDNEYLRSQLELAKNNFAQFDSLEKNTFFNHPYFQHLNKPQSKRLMEVHTQHHLKIIRDILKKEKSSS